MLPFVKTTIKHSNFQRFATTATAEHFIITQSGLRVDVVVGFGLKL